MPVEAQPKVGDQYRLHGTDTVFAVTAEEPSGGWSIAIGTPGGGLHVGVGMTKPALTDAIAEGKLTKIPNEPKA